jgi:hypothetical protein
MKKLTNSITRIGNELLDAVVESFNDTIGLIQRGINAVIAWHQRQMIVDPMYPRTLLTIGKALVTMFIPSALVATAVIALLSDLLGTYPHLFDQDDEYPDWTDPDWG